MHRTIDCIRTKRIQAHCRAVERLERQIAQMTVADKRFSQKRFVTFLIGVAILFLPHTVLSGTVRWITVGGAGCVFFIQVIQHHRLHHRLKRYRIFRDIKKANIARARVDWKGIEPTMLTIPNSYGNRAVDLNLVGNKSLHHLMDLSISERGSHRLADWLTTDVPDVETTRQRQAGIRELTALPHFRQRLLLNFHLASREKINSEKMTRWLNVQFPEKRIMTSFTISTGLLVLAYALLAIGGHLPFSRLWLYIYGLYLILAFYHIPILSSALEAAQWLDDELSVFSRILLFLERYPFRKDLSHVNHLCAVFQDPARKPSRRIRSLKLATACIGIRNNPIMALGLNLFFPWDLFFCQWVLRQRQYLQNDFPQWLDMLATLEAMNALANFAYINPDNCFPEFQNTDNRISPLLDAGAMGHPLIDPEKRVDNDFTIAHLGHVAIITGSNMAGKSTFLKSVGINLALAYAGGPVKARRFRTCFFRICTCIRISDSLSDGISSFYAEVKRLREILSAIEDSNAIPVIFFIDEILRGTNNQERLIGSTSLLRFLIQTRSAGLISTHDLELASLENEFDQIANYHFAETLREGKMFFRYRLRKGPCRTTNALHIMRAEGLPVALN